MSSNDRTPLLNTGRGYGSNENESNSTSSIVSETNDHVREQTVEAALLESFFDESQPMPISSELLRIKENQERHSHFSWYQRPSLLIICTLVMFFALAETLYMTPIVIITKDKICRSLSTGEISNDSPPDCDPVRLQVILSEITSKSLILSGIISTFMAGKMGELSDRYGRVHVFIYIGLIRLIGNAAHIYALWPSTPYYKWFIIIAASLNAFSGGMYAIIANANSYLSDITNPENRSVSFGRVVSVLFATMGGGFLIGSNIVTLFHGNNFAPVYFALGCSTLFIIMCVFFVTETRHEQSLKDSQEVFHRRLSQHRERLDSQVSSSGTYCYSQKLYVYSHFYATQLLQLLAPVKTLWIPRDEITGSARNRYTVVLLLVIDIAYMCSTTASMPALILFTTYMFDWQTVEIGYFVSFSGITRALILLLISPYFVSFLKKIYKVSIEKVDLIDMTSIRISMIAIVCGILMIITNPHSVNTVIYYASFQAFSALLSPTIQSAIVKYCPKDKTGLCFGGMALIRSLSMLVFPPLLLSIYGSTVSTSPAAFMYVPLLVSSLAVAFSFLIRP
ncbi:uncharacterized protein RNJ42_01662 [Nakaseomyces bracarensis]|uniref:uncharacterized protein n=1 Tax=Nakaseomyces bracarensis TaxID=273131 RepID=UPI0038728E81